MMRSLKSTLRNALFRALPPEVLVTMRHVFGAKNPSFSGKKYSVASEVQKERIVVLAPHPDDEVVGIGGSLQKHLQVGSDVTVVYLTNGAALSSSSSVVQARRSEAESLAREFPFRQIFWDVGDTKLLDDAETVKRLSDLLAELRPTTVFVPSPFESHYDHFAAALVLRGVLQGGAQRDVTVLCYEVWDALPFPNYFIDISQELEVKKKMMLHYKLPLEGTDFVRFFENRHFLHYFLHPETRSANKEGYLEAFYRLDPDSFVSLIESQLDALRASRSSMVTHFEELRSRPG